MKKGKLYLIPEPIHSEDELNSKYIPPYLTETINKIMFLRLKILEQVEDF